MLNVYSKFGVVKTEYIKSYASMDFNEEAYSLGCIK